MKDILNKLLILRTSGIGPVKYRSLLNEYGTDENIIEHLNLDDEFIDTVKREIDKSLDLGITYICDTDSRYPTGLLNVKNHPIVIRR